MSSTRVISRPLVVLDEHVVAGIATLRPGLGHGAVVGEDQAGDGGDVWVGEVDAVVVAPRFGTFVGAGRAAQRILRVSRCPGVLAELSRA